MRKIFIVTVIALLLSLGAAQAQKGLIENPDQAVEQMLFFRLVQQANLDADSMTQVLEGYTRYHATIDPLMASRGKLSSEIKEAVSTNIGGKELKEKVSALMNLDQDILEVNQQVLKDAGTLQNPMIQAQAYLLIYNRENMIAEARASLAGPCACNTPVAAAAPAAAALPAAAAAPVAAAPAAPAEVIPAVKEATSEEKIMEGVKVFADKLAAQDVKAATVMVSDKFTNMEYGDKAGLQDFLQSAADAGYLADLEVTIKDAKVKVDGEKATVSPVVVKGSFGEATLNMELAKADGAWKLVGLEIEGI